MDIAVTGIRSGQAIAALPAVNEGAVTGAQGHAAPAEDRAIRVQQVEARDAVHEARNPAPQILQLQAADSVARLAITQTDPARQVDARTAAVADRNGLQIRAHRAYSETSGMEAEVRALIDRVVLLPEKGDLSLEASKLPPYGPPPFGPPSETTNG
ncbi:hypothetical protein [Gemmobacter serpentinus]|uniref:hypothetical protein n=1 Tax=Gemmobacter serpentinus TaxID=2652247 RepID=UPI00124EF7CD|nr:hypothetical protein [Gemmobacter serpentinus]